MQLERQCLQATGHDGAETALRSRFQARQKCFPLVGSKNASAFQVWHEMEEKRIRQRRRLDPLRCMLAHRQGLVECDEVRCDSGIQRIGHDLLDCMVKADHGLGWDAAHENNAPQMII
ncbi:hypothetical protein AD937_01605 [Gluconobacter japonicus]|nr:hypothetical protein AD937_01605 [Gluconobacter japonicus]